MTFMSAMPDGTATPERKLSDRGIEFAAHSTAWPIEPSDLRLPAHRHVLARSRKPDRARPQATSRSRAEASARNG